MEKAKTKMENREGEIIAEAMKNNCGDRNCILHGHLKARGRTFEGSVVKKFPKRVVIELERMVYIRKYERYAKKKIRIHARLPSCMEDKVNIGDLITVQECRPLSKIIHFVVINTTKSSQTQDTK